MKSLFFFYLKLAAADSKKSLPNFIMTHILDCSQCHAIHFSLASSRQNMTFLYPTLSAPNVRSYCISTTFVEINSHHYFPRNSRNKLNNCSTNVDHFWLHYTKLKLKSHKKIPSKIPHIPYHTIRRAIDNFLCRYSYGLQSHLNSINMPKKTTMWQMMIIFIIYLWCKCLRRN